MNATRAFHSVLTVLTLLSIGPARAAGSARLEEREYELQRQDDGWQARNVAQGLQLRFTTAGIRVLPDTTSDRNWEFCLTLLSCDRAGTRAGTSLAATRVFPSGNRLDRDWSGIREWYVNEARGLKHEILIGGPPAGGISSEVHVDLALTGTLEPVISADGRAIRFGIPGGPIVLRYAELAVIDARGRVLPSRMEGFARDGVRGIRIVFDDTDAAYPVTVDPLLASAWSADSNQAGANFGSAVATAGDVNGDGYADVIIGADKYDSGQTDEGRAFVYLGSASGLAATPAWTAESNQASASFGTSVAPAGDVNGDGYGDVLVGAINYDNGQTDEGRAYLYLGSASGLAATPSWTAESDQATSFFGRSVATAGDVNGDGYADVLVGADKFDNGETDEGRAFLYLGSASGLSATPAWIAEGDMPGAFFGISVATAGDVNGDGYADVLVGAPGYNNGTTSGRVFLYLGSPSGLAPAPVWSAESDEPAAGFGRSVATAGDLNGDGYSDFVVGAHTSDDANTDGGAAFVYYGNATGNPGTGAWLASGSEQNEHLGFSVAPAGDLNGDGYADLVIGAYGWTAATGRVRAYLGSPAGMPATAAWIQTFSQPLAQFGWSVATAGDVNGDGFSDVIVGANLADNGQTDEGRAFVYESSGGSAPSATADVTLANPPGLYRLGDGLAPAGDFNGDGYSDLVAASGFSGQVYLYPGSASGLADTPGWQAGGFGTAVAGAGDVNGDGYDDIVVGSGSTGNRGAAYLYLGASSGASTVAAWTQSGQQFLGQFGGSVAGVGDVNGDGYADVMVGEPVWDAPPGSTNTAEGRAHLFLGRPYGLAAQAVWTKAGSAPGQMFGGRVGPAGDVNRDGYADAIVNDQVFLGSPAGLASTPVASLPGGVYSAGDVNGDGFSDLVVTNGNMSLYFGTPSGPSATPAMTIANPDLTGSFFRAAGGDVNGDGYSDVIVGSPGTYDDVQPIGRAFLFLGSASGLSPAAVWAPWGLQHSGMFAQVAVCAGDVNGDGYADLAVGAPQTDPGVFFYYGNGGRGVDRHVSQTRVGSGPIALGGKSDSMDSFRLRGPATSVAGGGRVRLERQVAALGTAFASASIQQGAAVVAGGSFDELVTGLDASTVYRWRARVAGDSPFFTSRWISAPGNSHTETDLRTFCNGAAVETCDGQDNDCNGVVDDVIIGSPRLLASRSGAGTQLSWDSVPGTATYDVVRGTLDTLRAQLGNFTAAINFCLGNDLSATSLYAPAGTGANYFFLVRAIASCGVGSYDSGSQSQQAPRDAEIVQSPVDCP